MQNELEALNKTSFEKFAPLYDTILSREKLLENPFFADIKNNIQDVGGGTKLLDIGCGTGDLCIFFANDGYNVTGIDYSDNMLIVARNKVSLYKAHMTVRKQMIEDPNFKRNANVSAELSSVRPKIRYFVDDVLKFDKVKDQFDIVTMADTISYIAPENIGTALKNINDRLVSGGHFCVILNTSLSFTNRLRRPEDFFKNFLDYSSGFSYDEAKGAYKLEIKFKPNDTVKEPVDVTLYEFLHPLRSFVDQFMAAGFQIVRMVPNTPVFAHDDCDIDMIIKNIDDTYSMPNGVYSVVIIGRKS